MTNSRLPQPPTEDTPTPKSLSIKQKLASGAFDGYPKQDDKLREAITEVLEYKLGLDGNDIITKEALAELSNIALNGHIRLVADLLKDMEGEYDERGAAIVRFKLKQLEHKKQELEEQV